jgi:hypothetical protein
VSRSWPVAKSERENLATLELDVGEAASIAI